MADPASQTTPPSARSLLKPAADLPVARAVAVLLILLPIAAFFLVGRWLSMAPAPAGTDSGTFDPRTVFSDSTPHFLPTPVAVLPANANTGPPAPAASDQASGDPASLERVKIANTGGAGALLRADPPRGRQVAALRDGTVLQVLERRQLDDGSEWLHVRAPDGTEGWVFSRLVGPAD